MIRFVITAFVTGLFLCSAALAADSKAVFTQKDFAKLMFQQFAWQDGLPGEATDRDYLQILGGKRKFRYEAENAYNPLTDRVTVREFALFGPFTGKGWLMGVSDTTTADFTVLLPIKGVYSLKAVIKGKGFIWSIDDKDYRADSGSDKFSEIEIGKIPLKAGIVKIRVSIPPESAIDSFSFSADDHAVIQPIDGWRFKEPLTAVRMAETALSITGRQEQLPDSSQEPPRLLAVFETATISPSAARTNAVEFGKFNSRAWIRADYRGATVQLPVKTTDVGFYRISANAMGGIITGSVNEVQFMASAKPYLDPVGLGLFRLESGDNLITINLPPMGGIDTLELRKKSISPEDALSLCGIKGPPERLISADEAKGFLKTIMDSYPVRK